MDTKTFQQFRDFIYEKSGITLGPQKMALVSARVGKRMRILNLSDYKAYLKLVRGDSSGAELVQLLDAISTNVTSFYREPVHYNVLAEFLEQWAKSGQTRFRIWCAASSSGEEPYCLAHLPQLDHLRFVFPCKFQYFSSFSALHFRLTLVCWAGGGRVCRAGWQGGVRVC